MTDFLISKRQIRKNESRSDQTQPRSPKHLSVSEGLEADQISSLIGILTMRKDYLHVGLGVLTSAPQPNRATGTRRYAHR